MHSFFQVDAQTQITPSTACASHSSPNVRGAEADCDRQCRSKSEPQVTTNSGQEEEQIAKESQLVRADMSIEEPAPIKSSPVQRGLLEGLVTDATTAIANQMTPYYENTKNSSAFLKAGIESVEGGVKLFSGPINRVGTVLIKGIDSQLERPAGYAVDAAYATANHLRTISKSLVRDFLQRMFDMRLITRGWHDIFQNCIKPIQNALVIGGFYDVVWMFSFHPHHAIKAQILAVLSELKLAVFTYLLQCSYVSSWVVECFLHRLLEEHAIQPWAVQLMHGLKCRVDFARQLTQMGLTNGDFAHGLAGDGDNLPVAPAVSNIPAASIAERRKSLLDRIKLAAIWQLVTVDHLLGCLVQCLVQRLMEDETITPEMHQRWLAEENIARVTLELQRQGCTSDGLCKFLLMDTLDLRKLQLVRSIHGIVDSKTDPTTKLGTNIDKPLLPTEFSSRHSLLTDSSESMLPGRLASVESGEFDALVSIVGEMDL
jgi:hypothetical protein